MCPRFHHITRTALLALAVLGLTSCKSIGPRAVPRDRSDYSNALAESWKNMMLLNIVKTRYLDLPIFLDVGQVVTGYSLMTSLNLNGSFATMGNGNALSLGGSGTYTDSPTITYTPLTGDKFLQGFLTPIEPARIFSLLQAGYAADFILQLGVESLNGLRNQPMSLGSKYKADPNFFRALELLRDIQDARAVGMRVDHPTNGQPAAVFFFRTDTIEPEILAKMTELRELLSLPPGQSSYRLVSSPLRGGPGELGVGTRSLWQILGAMSTGVELPPKHRDRKLAPTMVEPDPNQPPLLRVHSGAAKPTDPFVAVQYEGEWFWIAQDDWRSKRTFSSILFLFTLADTGPSQAAPLLTIPTR